MKLIDKEKLERLKKLADAMYYAAQYLTTDASRLHKAMDEYHKFIIHECKEEPVSEELETAIKEASEKERLHKAKSGSPFFMPTDFASGFKAGAQWQKEKLWKPADGDDLPEIDREVVAFQEIFPTDVDVPRLFKIVIAHRPNPDGWDGKSIATGEIKHYTPKTYDKGGWNIPDIVYWLDVDLPKEIEL